VRSKNGYYLWLLSTKSGFQLLNLRSINLLKQWLRLQEAEHTICSFDLFVLTTVISWIWSPFIFTRYSRLDVYHMSTTFSCFPYDFYVIYFWASVSRVEFYKLKKDSERHPEQSLLRTNDVKALNDKNVMPCYANTSKTNFFCYGQLHHTSQLHIWPPVFLNSWPNNLTWHVIQLSIYHKLHIFLSTIQYITVH